MFCPNCGRQLADQTAICPVCHMQLPRPVAPPPAGARKVLPILALCFGIAGIAVGMAAYVLYGFKAVFHDTTVTGSPLLVGLTLLLGLAAIVCGILGLLRSIRTGGRKYVAGIVLSAVGLYCGLNALGYSFISLLMNGMSGYFDRFFQFTQGQ